MIDRSIWLDEAYLVNNIPLHSLRFLLTNPLDSNQVSPVAFLVGLKILGKLFNYQEQFLRLLPLVSGLALLAVAYRLKNHFKHPFAQYLFLGMLAFCPVLIYYSSEIKSYILDTWFTVLLVFIGLNYRNWRRGYLILGIVGCLAIPASIPSVFVLAAVGASAAIQAMLDRDWPEMKHLMRIGLSWLIVFSLDYFFSLRNVALHSPIPSMWMDSFAPVPTTPAGLKWYLDSLLSLAALGFSQPAPVPVSDYPAWYAPLNWVILAIILMGAVFLYHRDRKWFLINLLIILIALLGSFLKFYPFRSRPILFMIPILFTFVCAFVDGLLAIPKRNMLALGMITAVFSFLLVCIPSIKLFLHPTNQEDIKGALTFIQNHKMSNDKLALSAWSYPAFSYYKRFYHLDDLSLIQSIPSSNNNNEFQKKFCAHPQTGRIWIVFSHRFNERINILSVLSSHVPLLMQCTLFSYYLCPLYRGKITVGKLRFRCIPF